MNLGEFPHVGSEFVYRFVSDETVKPCPFCNQEDSSYWAKRYMRDGNIFIASYWECNSCFAMLPFLDIPKKNYLVSTEVQIAKEKWNTRIKASPAK